MKKYIISSVSVIFVIFILISHNTYESSPGFVSEVSYQKFLKSKQLAIDFHIGQTRNKLGVMRHEKVYA